MERCQFVSSWGGVARCTGMVHRQRFCRFHHECYRRGEINDRGIISERLNDQKRRREINFHVPRDDGRAA